MGENIPYKQKPKESGMTMLKSDKIDFTQEILPRFRRIKTSIHKEDKQF